MDSLNPASTPSGIENFGDTSDEGIENFEDTSDEVTQNFGDNPSFECETNALTRALYTNHFSSGIFPKS